LFLRKPGAPLDNNRCEQALKMAILHRKNSLSYKTLQGARTGDRFMSLIHTCRLNGVNPFDYLLAIATHSDVVKLIPQAWLPWNYPKAPARTDTSWGLTRLAGGRRRLAEMPRGLVAFGCPHVCRSNTAGGSSSSVR
jgi:hypothetical protein